jgi:protein TonB
MRTLAVVFVIFVVASPSLARQVEEVGVNGVVAPRVVKSVPPTYTPEAIRARIEGVVVLGAVVQDDGTVANITVVRSLDSTYGLDEQAIAALKQWTFAPGTKDGKPVAVRVRVELAFNLRSRDSGKQ